MRPMPYDFQWFACTVLPTDSNKFLIVGSWLPNENREKCHIYDASTDTWTRAANLKIGRQAVGLVSAFVLYLLNYKIGIFVVLPPGTVHILVIIFKEPYLTINAVRYFSVI